MLIRQNKASLISSAADLIDMMLWNRVSLQPKKLQRSLFIELNEDEQKITAILSEKSSVHIDEIYIKSGFSSSFTAGILLTLEMRQVIRSLPGKLYQLIN